MINDIEKAVEEKKQTTDYKERAKKNAEIAFFVALAMASLLQGILAYKQLRLMK